MVRHLRNHDSPRSAHGQPYSTRGEHRQYELLSARPRNSLNAEGILTKRVAWKNGRSRGGKHWTQKGVHGLLTNPRYTGQTTHKGHVYPGEHDAILSVAQFERVQALLSANKVYTHNHQVRRFALLRRMIRCGHCGGRIMPNWTKSRGREYNYYTCTRKVTEGYGECPLPVLPAGEIETVVVDQLRALLRHPDVIARTYREVSGDAAPEPDAATVARLADLRKRREQAEKSIRAVLNVVDQNEGFMADQLKRLNAELTSLTKSIADLEAQAASGQPVELDRVGQALRAVDPVWDVLFPQEQQRIIRLLIETITISTSGIDIRFRTNGIEQIVQELSPMEDRTHA